MPRFAEREISQRGPTFSGSWPSLFLRWKEGPYDLFGGLLDGHDGFLLLFSPRLPWYQSIYKFEKPYRNKGWINIR